MAEGQNQAGNKMAELPFKVLLITDRGIVQHLKKLLSGPNKPGFRIVYSSRLSSAIKRIRAGGLDLVLLDFSLPDSQGIEGIRCILRDVPSMPVIGLSEIEDEALVQEALMAGAQDYLPFSGLDGTSWRWPSGRALERKNFFQAYLTASFGCPQRIGVVSDRISWMSMRRVQYAGVFTSGFIGQIQHYLPVK